MTTKSDNMADDVADDFVPPPVDDTIPDNGGDGAGGQPEPAAKGATPEPKADEPPEPQEPPAVTERNRISAEITARRRAEEAVFDPNDPNYVPPAHAARPAPAEPPAPAAADGGEPAPGPAAEQPTPEAPAGYSLRVNNQTMMVTRAQLLQYADMDDAEAAGMPDRALIRLAQKQIATEQALDEAKQLRRAARMDSARQPMPGNEPDDESGAADAGNPQAARRQNGVDPIKTVEAIVYEPPEVAAEALDRLMEEKLARYDQQRAITTRQQQIAGEIEASIMAYGRANPDLVANEDATLLMSHHLNREAVAELRNVGAINEQEAQALLKHDHMIGEAYTAARLDGHRVSDPQAIVERAGQRVRAAMGLTQRAAPAPSTPAAQQPVQQHQQDPRMAAKQQLTQQPTRGAPMPQTQQAPRNPQGRPNYSEAIRQQRISRGQTVG